MAKPEIDSINITLLRRRDPDAEQILGSSPHVTMYIMSVESQKWERRNVEGTLYVVKRKSNPRFQLVVLNKLSTENYVETIESGFHAEVSPPYLIYTQGGGKVHGVWFYEEGDLERIAALLTKVEASLPKARAVPNEPDAQAVGPQGAAEAGRGGGDDGDFWDKKPAPRADANSGPRTAPPTMYAPVEQAAPPTENAITSLFKNAQAKQQQQQQASSPAQAMAPLPPSYFHHSQPQPMTVPVMKAVTVPDGEHPIAKLFNKQPPPPPPPQPPAAPQVPGGALAALFNNATKTPATAPPPPAPRPAAPARPPVDDRLRVALGRLVAREDFLAMLADELRAVGLVNN